MSATTPDGSATDQRAPGAQAHEVWAIVVAAGYLTEPSGGDGGGPPVIPSLTLVTFEYQLIQLDTGLAAQRLRLSCDITWEPGALLDGFVCDLAPGQDEVASPFVPTDLTVLYGSR